MMAALMLMAGGMVYAQEPEKQDSTKKEAPTAPAPEEKPDPVKPEPVPAEPESEPAEGRGSNKRFPRPAAVRNGFPPPQAENGRRPYAKITD